MAEQSRITLGIILQRAIHGPGAWDRNPWVAVYELEKLA